MAASAAATVKINIVNICPTISPEKIENDNDGVNQDIKEPENSSSNDDLPF